MSRTNLLFFFLIGLSCFACKQNAISDATIATTEEVTKINLPQELVAGLDAHGGLAKWKKMQSLSFSLLKNDKKETHKTDLQTRKAFIEHPDWTLGNDGKEVWVSPNKEAFGGKSPRFYHNLLFYFYAMPFVLADEGINYTVLPQDTLLGKTYTPVQISYNDGVGDASDDEYIVYFDTETHVMGALLYTVTYYSGQKADQWKALIYDEWQEVNGILLPATMKGYKYADGELGDMRYERKYTDVELSEKKYDEAMFNIPEIAEIDPLITYD